MVRHLIFIVNDNTWNEHNKVGIAGINDGIAKKDSKTYKKGEIIPKARQGAISEVSGIRPGDVIYFNRMGSKEHPPELLGIYKATSRAYYDPSSLYQGAIYVKENLPFRIEFECLHNFKNPINIDEIWILKDKGKIWTLQQSRGDAVGVHACIGITKLEAEIINRLFVANNLTEAAPPDYLSKRVGLGLTNINKQELPLNFKEDRTGQLHYEAVLESLMLDDFADGKHKEIFGDYDEFIHYVPTGSRKEIDILLIKYDGDEIVWYQILELKSSTFTMGELQRLIDYEKWFIETKAETPLQVHPVGIAYNFNKDVIDFVKGRERYRERPIRLIKYSFNSSTKQIDLKVVV